MPQISSPRALAKCSVSIVRSDNSYSARTRSRLVTRNLRYPTSRRFAILRTSTSVSRCNLPPLSNTTDHIASARHINGTVISLLFWDGFVATVDLAELQIDTTALNLESARASSWGSAVEVRDTRGKIVHIDSAVLRAYCDPPYAAQLEQEIADIDTRMR